MNKTRKLCVELGASSGGSAVMCQIVTGSCHVVGWAAILRGCDCGQIWAGAGSGCRASPHTSSYHFCSGSSGAMHIMHHEPFVHDRPGRRGHVFLLPMLGDNSMFEFTPQ